MHLSKIRASKLAWVFLSTTVISASNASAFSNETLLTVDKKSLTKENKKYQWVNFASVASNGESYAGSISCFTADRTYNGVAHGSMHVLRERYHAGSYTDFSYETCQKMLQNLSEGKEEVILSWDQDDFEDLDSGELFFKRVIY